MDRIDVLLISPLGWSEHIWDKIKPEFREKKIEYLTFLDDSFSEIKQAKIEATLDEKFSRMHEESIIIAASFGTVVILQFLATHHVLCNRLILIDGFAALPTITELDYLQNHPQPTNFSSKAAYYEYMLSTDEQNDEQLLTILSYNLLPNNQGYRTVLSNEKMLSYLASYSGVSTKSNLENSYAKIKKTTIFSSEPLPVDYQAISLSDHLLMLTKPEKLRTILAQNEK